MTVKEHLKKICDYEQTIYEKECMIDKTNKEIARLEKEGADKSNSLDDKLSQKQHQLQETQSKMKTLLSYKPEGISKGVIIGALVIVATIIFHLVMRYFIVDVAQAQYVTDAWPTTIVMNLILIAPIAFCFWFFGDCEGTKVILIGGIAEIVLTTLGTMYLSKQVNAGSSYSSAILLAMWFFVAIEVIICIIVCCVMNNSQHKRAVQYRVDANKLKKQCATLQDQIEKLKVEIFENNTRNTKSLSLLKQDLIKLIREKTTLKAQLSKLYATNVIHPKYHYWVAAATLYEYFDVGTCFTLQGPDGAYLLYEKEVMANRIVNSIDELASTSKNINNSQTYIRKQLEAVNRKLDHFPIGKR